ncbi:hypothetical protein TSAR_008618 [Trichomalopsis sarcophagae]|uniref:DDE Tnp4 domain-containing protein n=1 Tax=Trichomalopsis sarcophagae TaxID=543379 RepID=A0A232EL92_9HYME|nr:hypothetical protein TSAR_008618 [Trichomalopsis sarcophagae]
MWLVINRSRKLHYSPEAVINIIHACAVLHNFRRRQGGYTPSPVLLTPDLNAAEGSPAHV